MGAGASIPEKISEAKARELAGDAFDEAIWAREAEENFLTDEMEVSKAQFMAAAAEKNAAAAGGGPGASHPLLDAALAWSEEEKKAEEDAVLQARSMSISQIEDRVAMTDDRFASHQEAEAPLPPFSLERRGVTTTVASSGRDQPTPFPSPFRFSFLGGRPRPREAARAEGERGGGRLLEGLLGLGRGHEE